MFADGMALCAERPDPGSKAGSDLPPRACDACKKRKWKCDGTNVYPHGCITLKRLLISLVVVSHAQGVSMAISVSFHLCLVYTFTA